MECQDTRGPGTSRTVVLTVLGIVVLTVIGALTDRDETSEDRVEISEAGWLDVGDCTDSPAEDSEYFEVNEVACDQEHMLEVFAFVDAEPDPDERFPGHEFAGRRYQGLCMREFRAYAKEALDVSEYSIYAVHPSRGNWNDGLTEGICLLARYDSARNLLPSIGSARDDEIFWIDPHDAAP